MGVMTRKQDDVYIITSDRGADDSPAKMAPKRRSDTFLRVWTGSRWSDVLTEAMTFPTLDAADDYTKANLARVMSDGGTSR